MGKEKIRAVFFLLIASVTFPLVCYCQGVLTQKLIWEVPDSTQRAEFHNTKDIDEWCSKKVPFSVLDSRSFIVDEENFLVSMVSGCSGISCWSICLFQEMEGIWYLVASSQARLSEKLEVELDSSCNNFVFRTELNMVGDFSINELLD